MLLVVCSPPIFWTADGAAPPGGNLLISVLFKKNMVTGKAAFPSDHVLSQGQVWNLISRTIYKGGSGSTLQNTVILLGRIILSSISSLEAWSYKFFFRPNRLSRCAVPVDIVAVYDGSCTATETPAVLLDEHQEPIQKLVLRKLHRHLHAPLELKLLAVHRIHTVPRRMLLGCCLHYSVTFQVHHRWLPPFLQMADG